MFFGCGGTFGLHADAAADRAVEIDYFELCDRMVAAA
jgi:hypothetical protein